MIRIRFESLLSSIRIFGTTHRGMPSRLSGSNRHVRFAL